MQFEKIKTSIILLALLALAGCQQSQPLTMVTGIYFDTVVTLQGDPGDYAALQDALAQCGQYEALLSKTREHSDVWRINHAQGAPVEVSAHTLCVLQKARQVSELSEGAFDITIGPLMDEWDFENGVIPDQARLAQALALVDYAKIKIEDNRVTMPAGMSIDLGGIAKGYVADQLAAYCRGAGLAHVLIDIGGNIVAVGAKPDGVPWQIGVQDPRLPIGYSMGTLAIQNETVVTSGGYIRGFDKDGVRYHHILDPASGWPARNGLASVTIIGQESIWADALSTACFVLGKERGMELAQRLQVKAVFVDDDGDVCCTPDAGLIQASHHN